MLARTPDAPAGVKGISLFIVPKFMVGADGSLGARNDVACVSLGHKLGIHGSPTAVMSFGDNGGATGFLVGEENRGLEYMFVMMNHARLNVGVQGLGIAERAYQQARAYACERVQGKPAGAAAVTPIADHPDVRRMLMTMKAHVEAMRALAYVEAAALDKAHAEPDADKRAGAMRFAEFLNPIVKRWSTETGVEMASLGVQVHGCGWVSSRAVRAAAFAALRTRLPQPVEQHRPEQNCAARDVLIERWHVLQVHRVLHDAQDQHAGNDVADPSYAAAQ